MYLPTLITTTTLTAFRCDLAVLQSSHCYEESFSPCITLNSVDCCAGEEEEDDFSVQFVCESSILLLATVE